jgi:hypothetical protein
MAEFETWVETEFEDEVFIDFSAYSRKERLEIAEKIINGEEVIFEDVPLYFAGEVLVDIEPQDWR